jgi:DNA polymerase I-like protein with 3'-5' exonuclease and polymerase domains
MKPIDQIKRVLVDARNFKQLYPQILAEVQSAQLMGFDIETHDENRHEGLNALMKVDDEGFRHSKKLIFDSNRTITTGISIYCDNSDTAYYFNLAHADVANCLSFSEVKPLLDAFKGYYVIHNAPYEIVMMEKSLNIGYKLPHGRVIDSLILCVTAYNSDTYSKSDFASAQLTGLYKLVPEILAAQARNDTEELELLTKKFVAKKSDAKHSYNGFVKDLAWGFGLKKATKHWLGYQQKTFEETLGDKPHMGAITGEEVVFYGADDAICCLQLYHTVLDWLMNNNPAAIKTFFEQENPCCWVYAQMNATGLRVDVDAIYKAQDEQRIIYAAALRKMQGLLRQALTENRTEHERLAKYSPWYVKNKDKYHAQIKTFVNAVGTDYELVNHHVRSPVGKGWSELEPNVINLSYYMGKRVILFSVLGLTPRIEAGKIISDADGCNMLKEKAKKEGDLLAAEVLETYETIASIEQALKLFINNFIKLTDPETGRMYPTISSLLDTRRTAVSNPNSQQLSKRGNSKYIRSFFLPDEDDHIILAPDWSAVELVIIGGYSNDANFVEAYGQRPHRDLHTKTAALMCGISVEEFNKLPNKKDIRKDIGKPSSFAFWYSGSLRTVGITLGWDEDKIREMTEIYRSGFSGGEQWRLDTIAEVKRKGFVQLPDNLIRYRYEATQEWYDLMMVKFQRLGIPEFGKSCLRRIQARASNQAVNSRVQGLCATYAKRKLYRFMFEIVPKLGLRARVMTLIHDELVISCHRDDVLKCKAVLYELMIDGEGIFNNVYLDSSMAMGRNFLAFDPVKNPRGLVELNEIDKKLPCIPENRWGEKATEEETATILDYLFK